MVTCTAVAEPAVPADEQHPLSAVLPQVLESAVPVQGAAATSAELPVAAVVHTDEQSAGREPLPRATSAQRQAARQPAAQEQAGRRALSLRVQAALP